MDEPILTLRGRMAASIYCEAVAHDGFGDVGEMAAGAVAALRAADVFLDAAKETGALVAPPEPEPIAAAVDVTTETWARDLGELTELVREHLAIQRAVMDAQLRRLGE